MVSLHVNGIKSPACGTRKSPWWTSIWVVILRIHHDQFVILHAGWRRLNMLSRISLVGFPTIRMFEPTLEAPHPAMNIGEKESNCNQRHRHYEADAKKLLGHVAQRNTTADIWIVGELDDVDCEEGSHEAHRQEKDGHNSEDQDSPPLTSGILCQISRKASFKSICVLLLEIAYLKQALVDTLGLFSHPLNVE